MPQRYLVAVLRFWKAFFTVVAVSPGRWRQVAVVSVVGVALLPTLFVLYILIVEALAPYILVALGFLLLIRLYRKLRR